MAYRSGDPFAGGSHASLVARGTEVAGFAGEGEQPLMAAIGAFEARESRGKILSDGSVLQKVKVGENPLLES
jgi:hypothetical protein